MKNSAWYHKLWRDKLDELPLKKDDDAAWADMRNMLDEQLPANAPTISKNAYKLSTLTKTILLLITVAVVTVPAILHISKHNTNSFKNSKQPHKHAVVNNTPNTLSDKSLSNDLIVADSDHHNSDSFAVSLSKNPKGTANPLNVNSKATTTNQGLQPLNTANLKAKYSQHQTNDKAKNGRWLNTSSVTLQSKLSKHSVIKGNNRHINSLTISDRQKRRLISNHISSTNYTSPKVNRNKATKNGSKAETGETSIPPTDNINNKTIASNNITVDLNKPTKLNNDKEAADTKIDPVKASTNNTDAKEAKNSGSRSRVFNTTQKTVKSKDDKSKSNTKKSKVDNIPPKYNYGLEGGYNAGHSHSLYAGAFASYLVKPQWLINIGLRLNTYQTISGEYSHQSYYSPDSIPAFKISDSRKVMALTVPLTLEYRLSKSISLKAGPVLSMQIKQSGISTKLGAVPNIRDTVYHTRMIDSTLQKTTINKLNVGFTGGVSIQIKRFNIEGMYQMLTPYKISSGLGSYQKPYQNFQIGIRYRFK